MQEKDSPPLKISKASLSKALILLKYVRPYLDKFVGGLVFLMISTLAYMAIPKLMGSLIDVATGKPSMQFNSINEIAFVLGIILVIQALFSFFRVIWFAQVSELSLAGLRKDTFKKLLSMSMDFFAQRRVGELHSRVSTDLSQIQDTLSTSFAEILRQGLILIVGITFLALTSWRLTLALLVAFPFLILFAVIFSKYIRKIAKSAQDQLADSNVIVEENLQGIADVKSFVNEYYESLRYSKSIDRVVSLALRGAKFRAVFIVFISIGMFGAIISVVWFGAKLVSEGSMSIGDLTSYVLYSGFVVGAMGGFADLFAQIQKTLGATERVLELLQGTGEDILMSAHPSQAPPRFAGNLVFEDVHFHYTSRADMEILKGVSFEVAAGKKLALVGESGAGKTTIASLMLRFYDINRGHIFIDGIDIRSISLYDLRSQIAIVPQDVLLFGGSIAENIGFGNPLAPQEAIVEAAKQANAHDFISSFPEAYATMVGERGVKLSGGQRQRIAIARALLKNPSILILDEATSSLDSESERLVQDALNNLMSKRTCIIIAHRLSTIKNADQIIVLKKGVVAEKGTHNELLQIDHGLYQYLVKLQF
ncbi:lipid ABC transporter permease/ATPase [Bacteroidales bacterium]|nr:lipid ABC transporter permease/ATPase [Bacteroidales bacterium]